MSSTSEKVLLHIINDQEFVKSTIVKHRKVIKEITEKTNQTLLKVEEIKEKGRCSSQSEELKLYNIYKAETESIFNVIKDYPNLNNPRNARSVLLDQTSTFSEYKIQQDCRIIQNSCILRKLIDLMLKLNQVKDEIVNDESEEEDFYESNKENQ
ncbi:hypothetical protein ACFFRR_005571 [Megaselia abdita]